MVSYLTEELVHQGHDVTLFASGDSQTNARLIPCCPRALRLTDVKDSIPYHLIMLDEVRRYADAFDVLHFHIDLRLGPASAASGCGLSVTMVSRRLSWGGRGHCWRKCRRSRLDFT